jgi:hypothetical protein
MDDVCIENGGVTLAGCQKWWDPDYKYASGLGDIETATWKKGKCYDHHCDEFSMIFPKRSLILLNLFSSE